MTLSLFTPGDLGAVLIPHQRVGGVAKDTAWSSINIPVVIRVGAEAAKTGAGSGTGVEAGPAPTGVGAIVGAEVGAKNAAGTREW